MTWQAGRMLSPVGRMTWQAGGMLSPSGEWLTRQDECFHLSGEWPGKQGECFHPSGNDLPRQGECFRLSGEWLCKPAERFDLLGEWLTRPNICMGPLSFRVTLNEHCKFRRHLCQNHSQIKTNCVACTYLILTFPRASISWLGGQHWLPFPQRNFYYYIDIQFVSVISDELALFVSSQLKNI